MPDLARASYNLTVLLNFDKNPRGDTDQDLKLQERKKVVDRYVAALESCFQKWLYHRLFIEDEEDKTIAEYILKTNSIPNLYKRWMTINDVSILREESPEILRDLDMIMNKLRYQFQDILQGKDAEQTASRK